MERLRCRAKSKAGFSRLPQFIYGVMWGGYGDVTRTQDSISENIKVGQSKRNA